MYLRFSNSYLRKCKGNHFSIRKMKLLEKVQRYYTILGIYSTHQLVQKSPLNRRAFIAFSIFGSVIISQFIYTFHVSNGFLEYVDSICATFGSIVTFVCFAAVYFRRTTTFGSIDHIERLIDRSESIYKFYK